MKVAVNDCFGGFGLSEAAYSELGVPWDGYGYAYGDWCKRSDPRLIEVIERLGEAAAGDCSKLRIVEIPDGKTYEIKSYDGIETVVTFGPYEKWR